MLLCLSGGGKRGRVQGLSMEEKLLLSQNAMKGARELIVPIGVPMFDQLLVQVDVLIQSLQGETDGTYIPNLIGKMNRARVEDLACYGVCDLRKTSCVICYVVLLKGVN